MLLSVTTLTKPSIPQGSEIDHILAVRLDSMLNLHICVDMSSGKMLLSRSS